MNVSQRADPAPAGDTRARVSSGFGSEKTACLISVLALLGILGGGAVDAADALKVRVHDDPVILVLPSVESPRTVSFAVASTASAPGKLILSQFDPFGHRAGRIDSVGPGRQVSLEVPADGPRQIVLRADAVVEVRFAVSAGPWALYFPSGRGGFAALWGRKLIYFPRDNTPGVLPSIRIRVAGTGAGSRLDRLNVRWRVAPERLRFGPFAGRFDHSFTAACRGGEVLLHTAVHCRDTIIHFPDRPYAVVSDTSPVIAKELVAMVHVLPPAANLVTNGGFETDLDANGIPDGGWWRYNPFECDLAPTQQKVHGGGKSLRCGVPSGGAWVSRSLQASPGDTVRLSFWAAADDLETVAHGTIGLRDKNMLGWKGKGEGDVVVNIPSGTSSWKRYQGEMTVPDNAHFFYCEFGHQGKRGRLYVDDVTVTRLTVLSATISPRSPPPVVGNSTVVVRLRSAANGPGRVEVHAGVVGAKEQKAAANVVPGGGEVDVPVPVVYPKQGSHEVAVKVVAPDSDVPGAEQRLLASFKTTISVPELFYTRIIEPCYVCLEDNLKEVTTQINVNASADVLENLRLSARLTGPADKELWSQESIRGSIAGTVIRIPIEGLFPGRYLVRVTLSGARTQKPQTRTMDFHIVHRGQAVVRIDDNQKLVAGGKPFFPIGIWPIPDNIKKIAVQTGANCLMNWTWASFDKPDGAGMSLSWMKWALDEAHKHDMKWMCGTPMVDVYGTRFKSARRRVKALRDHPGVLVWEEDEIIANAGLDAYESVRRIYNITRKEDPNHPFVSGDLMAPPGNVDVQIPTTGGGSFAGIVFPPNAHDIAMWWWYPIPLPPEADGFGDDSAYEYVTNGVKLAGDKPLWLALQVFAWTRTKTDAGEYRYPTLAEIKCMTYLAVAWGVDGLFYYAVVGGGETSDHMSLMVNEPRWNQFRAFTKDLRELQPVLCAADERAYQASPKDFAADSVMKTVAGKKYIIASNRSRTPRQATFRVEGLGDRRVTVLKEGRAIDAKAGKFTDAFGGFGTHVYVWDQ